MTDARTPSRIDPTVASSFARRGFTLVELLVVIAIIGTLVGLLLPAVQSARESARSNTCRNNLKQLNTAFINYDSTQRKLPGYVNELPNRGTAKLQNTDTGEQVFSIGRRASWMVMLFPYIEQSPLWDQWTQVFPNSADGSITDDFVPELESTQCPSDPSDTPGSPAMSYVVNTGQALNCGSRGSTTAPTAPILGNTEYAPNGVFFDQNRNNATNVSGQGWPIFADGREANRPLEMTIDYIQASDGTSKTMLVTENIHAVWYTYPPASFEPQVATTDVRDAKHHFGFVWHNIPATGFAPQVQRINGGLDRNVASPDTLANFFEGLGYPSSNHPGGVNIAFADGRVQYVSENLDELIYPQLMTTKHKRSKYYDVDSNTPDRLLPQPTESDL